MKKSIYLVFTLLLVSLVKIQAQCSRTETLSICDMTIIDGNSDSQPDGIINLYDEYNGLTGLSTSLATGTWFDPDFNFALDETTGELYLWDLDNSSKNIDDYQFQLIDTNSSCTGGVIAIINVVLGPFSGFSIPATGVNDVNVEICDANFGSSCVTITEFDLFQTLLSVPSPHQNGIWTYEGSSPNFIGILEDRYLQVNIPYQQGVPLVDEDTFELVYTVEGISSCMQEKVETRVKVSVIRDVFSGEANTLYICESEIIAGDFDNVDLRDNRFLVNEDVEGVWLYESDSTGELEGPSDSVIDLRGLYDDLYITKPKFGCQFYEYTYSVDSRSGVCEDQQSTVKFVIFEYLRPFQQTTPVPEFCVGGQNSSAYNLYDLLTFTTENNVTYNYPPKSKFPSGSYTNWSKVSGPASNLSLNSFSGDINLSNITNADAGTYVFEYVVSPNYNCDASRIPDMTNGSILYEEIFDPVTGCSSLKNPSNPCLPERAQVTLTIHPKLYAGEDTSGLEFCENDPLIASPLDLFSLLTTNMIDDPIYQGPLGTWFDGVGNPITNPITLPEVNGQGVFNFVYTTQTPNGCTDRASLSFTIFEEYQSGASALANICNNNAPFNLFDSLGGNPNTNGTWVGPNGFTTPDQNAIIDPTSSDSGVYTYSVPDNLNTSGTVICTGNSSTVTLTLFQGPNVGTSGLYAVCQSDLQIDLVDYLDASADSGGIFKDLGNTNALTGSLLDVSQLTSERYNFQYEIQGQAPCGLSASIITISIVEVPVPMVENQTFCAVDGATINDLVADNGQSFNWYDTETATMPLPMGAILINGEDYFVSAVDNDNCESKRVSITVSILPVDDPNCYNCLKDGISVNGDGENDEFDLCNLPVTFPDFEIHIFNRYGSEVFKGNINTSLFNGISNTSLTLGNKLPSGVYFYIFDPNDGITKPFQGNFYLSR